MTHFACSDDNFRGLKSGGWYHNGVETRRLLPTLATARAIGGAATDVVEPRDEKPWG